MDSQLYLQEMGRTKAYTAEDVPPSALPDATIPSCPDHPDADYLPGYGYAGGGFGPYRVCAACRRIFGKVSK